MWLFGNVTTLPTLICVKPIILIYTTYLSQNCDARSNRAFYGIAHRGAPRGRHGRWTVCRPRNRPVANTSHEFTTDRTRFLP
jgi:hypothetical protein